MALAYDRAHDDRATIAQRLRRSGFLSDTYQPIIGDNGNAGVSGVTLFKTAAGACAPGGSAPSSSHRPSVASAANANGETQIRTGDTTIFSRVLYQLSYLAATRDGSAGSAFLGSSARTATGLSRCECAGSVRPSSNTSGNVRRRPARSPFAPIRRPRGAARTRTPRAR
jgi:hypothetical protein